MTLEFVLFAGLALIVVVCAILVVASQNVVRSAVWLLFTLVGTSLLYFLLGAEFVGATQLIVYVGGTMVLVVFGVMLTAQQQFLKIKARPQEWLVAGTLAAAFFALLVVVSFRLGARHDGNEPQALPGSGPIGVGFLSTYLLPFEIVSVHLLVVLIGAAYLARAKRRPKDGAS